MPKPAPEIRPRASKLPNRNGKKKAPTGSAPHLTSASAAPDRGWLLVALVFFGGLSSLAVEMAAARLLAAFFGDSQFVWATLIGLTLIYLTTGYYLGGKLADRAPQPLALYRLTAAAAATIGLIPLLADAILHWSEQAFARSDSDISAGPLIAILLLFSLPVILLGCVSPFAIRLRVQAVGSAGSTAGRLYALSTVGSLLGTFLPVFWLMPSYGVHITLLIVAGCLMAISAAGLILERFRVAVTS
jgi:predicted membrane-bound spermidine synthase